MSDQPGCDNVALVDAREITHGSTVAEETRIMRGDGKMSASLTKPGDTAEEKFEADNIRGEIAALGKALDTFICFPKLPIELRLKIWKEAMPGPRIIDIAYDYNHSMDNIEIKWENPRIDSLTEPIINERVMVNHPPPVVLHVCRESRTEAVKKYSIKLGHDGVRGHDLIDPLDDLLHVVHGGPKIYSEPEDIVTEFGH